MVWDFAVANCTLFPSACQVFASNLQKFLCRTCQGNHLQYGPDSDKMDKLAEAPH